MSKTLVIVESPAKAKTIAQFLDDDHRVVATMGPLRDLPLDRMGVDVEKEFEAEYVLGGGKDAVVSKLREGIAWADQVLFACDNDREGESTAWHVIETLRLPKKKYARVTFPTITAEAVQHAMEHPGKLDQHFVNAQEARRVLDRLVGYRVSPVLREHVEKSLTASRGISIALRLLSDRENEIDAFDDRTRLILVAEGETDEPPRFKMRLTGALAHPASEDAAKEAIREVGKGALDVTDVHQAFIEHAAPDPFTTATMLQEASKRIRFTPKKTMMIAQRLHEGVEIEGEGLGGLITHPRTVETCVDEATVEEARQMIAEAWGEEHLGAEPPAAAKGTKTRPAMEAIRPARLDLDPDSIADQLSRDQLALYRLIWDRFMASLMPHAEVVETRITLVNRKGHEFEASAAWVTEHGFLELWDMEAELLADFHPTTEDMPAFEVGQSVKVTSLKAVSETPTGPEPHTPASLIAEMASLGIGRPSTQVATLAAIQEAELATVERGALRLTPLGAQLSEFLQDHFTDLTDINRAAMLEKQLDQVANGKANASDLLRGFHTTLTQRVKAAQTATSLGKGDSRPAGVECDRCGAQMLIKWGRNGRFLGCSNYPSCRNTMEYETDGEEETLDLPQMQHRPAPHQMCPTCGKPMIIKSGRRGRFAACSGYPDCKTAEPLRVGVACPNKGCQGQLVERQSKKGRLFWACDAYPACDFTVWERPTDKPCPECGFPFLVLGRGSMRGREKCPDCGYKTPPPQLRDESAPEATGRN